MGSAAAERHPAGPAIAPARHNDVSILRSMLRRGRSAEALVLADRAVAQGLDPPARAEALLYRTAALINLGRRAESAAAAEAAAAAVEAAPSARRYGRLHSLSAIVAHLGDSLERCVSHLVQSARALSEVTDVDEVTACAWHDLAQAYSFIGFHGHALGAMDRARKIGVSAGVSEAPFVTPAIRVRLAVWHDHNGDTDACMRVLRDVIDEFVWHRQISEHDPDGMRPVSLGAYGYAVARLAALGEPIEKPQAWPLLEAGGQSLRARDLRVLGEVCLAIAGNGATTALALLDQANVASATMGGAEPHRLRALAHLAAGNPAEAYQADRHAYRVASAQTEQLRNLFIDGMAAWLDRESMRRTVARYQDEALTDPLTGLPNRRFLEQHVSRLTAEGHRVIIGICDLDGFKAVNTVHGHLTGDLVLQRISGVLARVMRRGDFVARYGGDEFVVVLPDTDADLAREIAHRIVGAVDAEDWSTLAPGTPIGVTIGWSEVASGGRIAEAFAAADRAMLKLKAG